MAQKEQPVQGSLFPELEPQEAHPAKPSKKSSKQIQEELKEKIKKLEETIAVQNSELQDLKKENATLKVKAEAFDDLITCKTLFPLTTIAKAFGRTAIWMNEYLAKKGIQFKNGEIWTLYSKYDKCGYTGVGWYEYGKDIKGRALVRAHTYWTVKGMAFIREKLIEDGYWQD